MLVYNYKTPGGKRKQIAIEIAGNSFANYWVNYIDRLSNKCPAIEWYIAGLNSQQFVRSPRDNVYDLLQIRDAFNYINSRGLCDLVGELGDIERLMAFPEKVDQVKLNTWHRIFTSLEMEWLKLGKKLPESVDRHELWQYIQNVNTYVHHMEMWTYHKLDRRLHYKEHMQYSIQFTNADNLNYRKKANQVFGQENLEWIDGFTFDFFNEKYDYSVWLHEDITGKDQMKAWLDNDDLTAEDITGNLLMTPSITLDPYMIYKRILDDKNFRFESKKSNKLLNRFPLGTILCKDQVDWPEFFKSKVENVLLFGKVLWPKEFI